MTSASKSPSWTAARNASTTRRCCRRSFSEAGAWPWTRRRARLASWRVATTERSTMGAISSKVIPNTSWSTNASRSAGSSFSRTTSSARPTESASMASASGPSSPRAIARAMIGSGTCTSKGSSRRDARVRSMSRHTRATTVVSHPRRLSTPLTSVRLNRIQASWTASSASLTEPSMRYATARTCDRCSSNCPASRSGVGIGHIPPARSAIVPTNATPLM